jgi:RNA polymerase sigma factor (TIGR02999 family)
MSNTSSGTITELLAKMSRGEPDAVNHLVPLLYRELRTLAARCMAGERRNHTLEPTALAHEAYLRLVNQHQLEWHDRTHFLSVAARVMRRLLVDHARRRKAARRGGGQVGLTLGAADIQEPHSFEDIIDIDRSLEELTAIDERQARIVEGRIFGGLTVDEIAAVEGVSPGTVQREWNFAKAWLRRELNRTRSHDTAKLAPGKADL